MVMAFEQQPNTATSVVPEGGTGSVGRTSLDGSTSLDGRTSLVTRHGLAKALNVSIRTIDQLIADGTITPIRLGGKLVRFYLPDVIAELRSKAKTSKHPCTRSI
jgi:excisionase family DNA binding protein